MGRPRLKYIVVQHHKFKTIPWIWPLFSIPTYICMVWCFYQIRNRHHEWHQKNFSIKYRFVQENYESWRSIMEENYFMKKEPYLKYVMDFSQHGNTCIPAIAKELKVKQIFFDLYSSDKFDEQIEEENNATLTLFNQLFDNSNIKLDKVLHQKLKDGCAFGMFYDCLPDPKDSSRHTCQCQKVPFETKLEFGVCRMVKDEPCTKHVKWLPSANKRDYPAYCSTGDEEGYGAKIYCKHRDGRICAPSEDLQYLWGFETNRLYHPIYEYEPVW